jgi:hypothetical protein
VCGYVTVEKRKRGGFVLEDEAATGDASSRAAYLEREIARLQRLVAELLIKNEQLRQMYLASLTVSD